MEPSHPTGGGDQSPLSPSAEPNASHFPNTVKLMQARRQSSLTPETSPARDRSVHSSTERASQHATAVEAPHQPLAEDDLSAFEGDAEAENSPEKRAKKRSGVSNRQALAARVQERLDSAQQRRDQLQDERAARLKKAEQHRQQKTQLQKEMRLEAMRRFLVEAPALLNEIAETGLTLPEKGVELDGNTIQHILMTDPRVCEKCPPGSPDIYQRICPVSGKPHRRRLIMLSEKLLKLIGETRVNLVVRKDAVGDAALAMSSNKARRGIAINPQIFVLAYYNAAKKDQPVVVGGAVQDEEDPLLMASARQLIEDVAEIHKVLHLNVKNNETARVQAESTMKPLLQTFARHWQQYARLAEAAAAPQEDKAKRQTATNEVLESTIATAAFVHRHWKEVKNKDMDEEERQNTLASLSAYSQMLFHRALSIAGEDGVNRMKERLTAVDAEAEAGGPTPPTAAQQPTTATTTSAAGTSSRRPPPVAVVDSSEEDTGTTSHRRLPRGEAPPPQSPVIPTAPVISPADEGRVPASSTAATTTSSAEKETAPSMPTTAAAAAGSTGGAAPSDSFYTSGSETDVGRRYNRREKNEADKNKKPMGPELPPRWYVDENGISRPPRQPTKEELAREKYKTLEHKAKTAYEAKIQLFKESSQGYIDEVEEAKKKFTSTMTEAFWDSVKTELNSSPPIVAKIPPLLQQVTSRLVEAVPKRYQQRVSQEMRDVLDWDMLKYRLADPKHLSELLRYVIGKVNTFGTPAREAELRKTAEEISQKLLGGGAGLGEAVVEMFKFLLQAISDLLSDIAQYQLTVLQPELSARAVDFQRSFTDECLSQCTPESWPSTMKWLVKSVENQRKAATTAASTTTTTAGGGEDVIKTDSAYIKGVVQNGIVDLLASANTSPETRWNFFPQETMHFDKPNIFTASNLIQLFTLRMMIIGTVQLVLNKRKIPVDRTTFLKDLDATLVALLSNKPRPVKTSTSASTTTTTTDDLLAEQPKQPMTLESLKSELLEEVNMFLADRALNLDRSDKNAPGAYQPGEVLDPLTTVEASTIKHSVESMTVTTSMQYAVFEKRVMAALRGMVAESMNSNTIPPRAPFLEVGANYFPKSLDFAKHLPKLQEELYNAARDVSTMLMHHFDVYKGHYEKLLTSFSNSAVAEE